MTIQEVNIGTWVEVEMYKAGSWNVTGMTSHSSSHRSQNYIPGSRQRITYWLPIIDKNYDDQSVKLLHPPYDYFTYLGSSINGWALSHAPFRLNYSWIPTNLILNHNNNLNVCLDCGWFCNQQCWKISRFLQEDGFYNLEIAKNRTRGIISLRG